MISSIYSGCTLSPAETPPQSKVRFEKRLPKGPFADPRHQMEKSRQDKASDDRIKNDPSFKKGYKKGLFARVAPKPEYVITVGEGNTVGGEKSPLEWKIFYEGFQKYTAESTLKNWSGALQDKQAVTVKGGLVPLDTPGEDGSLSRFWLANPEVVMAGCTFCNPPNLGDLIYVSIKGTPVKLDRERMYSGIVKASVTGRFVLGPKKTKEGYEFLYGIEVLNR